jgi:hypothetical protein
MKTKTLGFKEFNKIFKEFQDDQKRKYIYDDVIKALGEIIYRK